MLGWYTISYFLERWTKILHKYMLGKDTHTYTLFNVIYLVNSSAILLTPFVLKPASQGFSPYALSNGELYRKQKLIQKMPGEGQIVSIAYGENALV